MWLFTFTNPSRTWSTCWSIFKYVSGLAEIFGTKVRKSWLSGANLALLKVDWCQIIPLTAPKNGHSQFSGKGKSHPDKLWKHNLIFKWTSGKQINIIQTNQLNSIWQSGKYNLKNKNIRCAVIQHIKFLLTLPCNIYPWVQVGPNCKKMKLKKT